MAEQCRDQAIITYGTLMKENCKVVGDFEMN